MKRLNFESPSELGQYMIDKAQDGFYTVAVLFYNEALALIRDLMSYEDIEVESLTIEPEEYGGYDKEYYVSLADDMVACVEPAYSDGRYLTTDADLTLIDGDASSTAIKDIDNEKCREIHIGEKNDDDFSFDEDDELNTIFEKAELIRNDKNEIVGIRIDAESLFNYLFH